MANYAKSLYTNPKNKTFQRLLQVRATASIDEEADALNDEDRGLDDTTLLQVMDGLGEESALQLSTTKVKVVQGDTSAAELEVTGAISGGSSASITGDIDGGALVNTPIGQTGTPAAGKFAHIDATSLTVEGTVTIKGDTVIQDSQTMTVEDNLIVLNKGEAGAGVTEGTSGIQVDRGSETDAELVFNDANDRWEAGLTGALLEVILADSGKIDISEIEHTGNITIDAVGAAQTEVLVGNSGAADVKLTITGILDVTSNITTGGTVDGIDVASHAGNADAHHNRQHGLMDTDDHTVSGLTARDVLIASAPTTWEFRALVADDLPDLSSLYAAIATLTSKGDIYYHNGTGVARLGKGAQGEYLIADATSGLKWTVALTTVDADDVISRSWIGM